MPEVWIPTSLQRLTGGEGRVQASGSTIRQVIDSLDQQFPGIKARLCEDGQIMDGIAVIVDGEDTALGVLEKVSPESEIHFLQAIGGGCL